MILMYTYLQKARSRPTSRTLNAADINMHMAHQLSDPEKSIDHLMEKELGKDCSLEPEQQSNVTFKCI